MSISLNNIVQINLNVSPESVTSNTFNKAIVLGTSLSDALNTYEFKLHEYSRESFAVDMATDGYTVSGASADPEFRLVQAYFAQDTNLSSIYVGDINASYSGYEGIVSALEYFRNLKIDWYYVCVAEQGTNVSSTLIHNSTDLPSFIAAVNAFSIPTFYVGCTTKLPTDAGVNPYTIMKNAGSYKTALFYYASDDKPTVDKVTLAGSVIGKLCSLNTLADNSAYTLTYKTLNNETSMDLDQATVNAILAQNANSYVNFGNGSYNLIYKSLTSKGYYIDESFFIEVAQNFIQNSTIVGLVNSKKIPLTDDGMEVIKTYIVQNCERLRDIGFIDSGIWNGGTVGNLSNGDAIQGGYYIEIAPVSTLTAAERALRKSPNIKVALKSTGAVEHVVIDVNIDR